MPARTAKIGDRINNWLICSEVGKNASGAIIYDCKCCNCGNHTNKYLGSIKANRTGRCAKCPPGYNFQYFSGYAKGVLPDGSTFYLDEDLVEEFSKYYWIKNSKGYIQRSGRGLSKLMLHWLALGYHSRPPFAVDHINQNKLDCRCFNLRFVSAEQNTLNHGITKRNKTGYVGPVLNKKKGTYISKIQLMNKNIYLGRDLDLITAAQMHNYAAEILFGEFNGYHNDVPELSNDLKIIVREKLRKSMTDAMIAQLPVDSFLYKASKTNIARAI